MGYIALKQIRNGVELTAKIIKSDHAKTLRILGNAYHTMGENRKAKAAWEKALVIEPNNQAILDYLNRVR